jgi:anti-sigma B factor antagonist
MDAVSAADLTAEVSSQGDGTAVVSLIGEIDLATVEIVTAALADALEHDPERLVFDLSGVEFMDSSGIAALLRARKSVPAVQLRDPSTAVRRLLEMTGLTEVLPTE